MQVGRLIEDAEGSLFKVRETRGWAGMAHADSTQLRLAPWLSFWKNGKRMFGMAAAKPLYQTTDDELSRRLARYRRWGQ